VKILFDENLSPRHASRLRMLGIDAVAVSEVGLSGASDSDVRAFSIADGRLLITMDADFGNILRYPAAETPGVIWLRLHPPTEAGIAAAVDRVLGKLSAQDLTGKLVVVDEDKIRVRG
jgi:predicted nuclease of predicted toxin-antitoxin system